MDILVLYICSMFLFLSCRCLKPKQLSSRLNLLERRLDAEVLLRRDEAEQYALELEYLRGALENKTNEGHFESPVKSDPSCKEGNSDTMMLILREAFADEKLLSYRVRRSVKNLESDMDGIVQDNTRTVTNVSREVVAIRKQLEGTEKKRQVCEDGIQNLDKRVAALTETVNEMKSKFINLDSLKNEMQDIYKQIGGLSEKLQTVVDYVVLLSNKFESCHDLLTNGRNTSGVYDVYPNGRATPIRVYCDQVTDGGGWTVFQRRQDGKVDFYRGWDDYKHGFGDVKAEFWLGNEHLWELTRSGYRGLRIDMKDFDNKEKHASYAKFRIGSESEKYSLFVEGFSGNAGDSMGGHNTAPFSTKDRDNDSSGSHCSTLYKGAWWYTSCHSSNLNGQYHHGDHKTYADGVNWQHWRGYHHSLKFVEMKLR